MNLNAPKMFTWMIAVVLGLMGILIQLDIMSIPALERLVRPFWLVTGGFGLLAAGNVFKSL